MRKKRWIIPIVILFLIVLSFLLYTANYYRAAEEGRRALKSDGVTVEKTGFGWRFDGPADDAALIFYPGAKVDEAAYAPLLHRLAESGVDVCLVKMPLHFAIFGADKADRVMERFGYQNWYIGGHSLGGVMAARYAAKHDLQGVILLASYPIETLDEPMLLVYGSVDGVLNRERVENAAQYGSVETVVIEGGNHAGFGNYGKQRGDNPALISAEEQQERTLAAIETWLAE